MAYPRALGHDKTGVRKYWWLKSKITLTLSLHFWDSRRENRLRHQYAMRRRHTTVHKKVLYSRERGNVRDWLDIRAASRTTNMIADAAQTPLSVAR